jgi:hypothetical protein
MADRCSGHCCKAFFLPYSYTEMRRRWIARLKGDLERARSARLKQDPWGVSDTWLDDAGKTQYGTCTDDRVVFPMLLPLGKLLSPIRSTRPLDEFNNKPGNYYSCRYLKPNGDCGAYGTEKRPNLCGSYPDGGKCHYEDCTWSAGRAATYPGGVNDPDRPVLKVDVRKYKAWNKVEEACLKEKVERVHLPVVQG